MMQQPVTSSRGSLSHVHWRFDDLRFTFRNLSIRRRIVNISSEKIGYKMIRYLVQIIQFTFKSHWSKKWEIWEFPKFLNIIIIYRILKWRKKCAKAEANNSTITNINNNNNSNNNLEVNFGNARLKCRRDSIQTWLIFW